MVHYLIMVHKNEPKRLKLFEQELYIFIIMPVTLFYFNTLYGDIRKPFLYIFSDLLHFSSLKEKLNAQYLVKRRY